MREHTPQPRIYRSGLETSALKEAFQAGEFPVAVYGLGKMGLPVAGVFGEVSGNVVGADIDSEVVESVNSGKSHVNCEPGLDELVESLVDEGSLSATTSPREVAEFANIHIIIVPTTITDDKEPDLSILDAVVDDIAAGLSQGDFIIIESTVPPQTTEQSVYPTLVDESGLSKDEFGLAFCPERTSSGRALKDIRGAYPKVVGGVDAQSTEAAKVIYEVINDKGVITVKDATTAEAVKVFEGLYRDVNIALANELSRFTDEMGINVREAIEVANTQPFCNIHEPGPGVGGHCIPFYPYFMIEPFETETALLETAREVNDSMPVFTVKKLREEFDAEDTTLEETDVLILGLTYRPGVEEIRASPSLSIASNLTDDGATVYGADPVLEEFTAFDLHPISLDSIYDRSFDAVVHVTPHDEFADLRWEDLTRDKGDLIVIDGRQSLDLSGTDHRVYTIGSGYDG